MKIAAGTLMRIIPENRRAGIRGAVALEIVHRQYCGPMTVRGFCPQDCQFCQPALDDAFQLAEANNPQALLTYRLKLQLANAQDRAGDHRAERKTDAYGLPVPEGNPFELLKSQYESPAEER